MNLLKREIKFRAWDKKEKRMWWNVQNAYDTLGWHHTPNPEDRRSMEGEALYQTSFEEVLEDPDLIVMEFTGLRDKNKKEIYEGDIVDSYYCGKTAIVWSCGAWMLEVQKDQLVHGNLFVNCDTLKIIGNIYESESPAKVG